jgi:uncharacterized membrane protein YphA (DoxX/SURF4 family)
MSSKRVEVVAKAAVWAVTIFLAVVFVLQGSSKFSDTSGWTTSFMRWGYPRWFQLTIGALEIIAGMAVLVPKSAPIGAVIIVLIMVGAMWTHLVVEHTPGSAARALFFAVLASVVFVIRWRALSRSRQGDPVV